MRQISYTDLEVEIVREIRKWRDELISDVGADSPISDIDAGDACGLASHIAENIYPGVEVIGLMESRRKLNEGWEK